MNDIELFNKVYEEKLVEFGDEKTAFNSAISEFSELGDTEDVYLSESYSKFKKNYKKLIRIGFIGILIVPLVFMILMFNLESKIVYLSLWIASIVISAVYLIILEYANYSYRKKLGLITEDENEGDL